MSEQPLKAEGAVTDTVVLLMGIKTLVQVKCT